jgi:RNA polymerase sigma factor (sigma-70 family)
MTSASRAYDLDMTQVGDEELVVLAKECGFRPARDELILRFRDRSNRLIWQGAGFRRVPTIDVEDAQQDAVFWVIEAIEHYDTSQIGVRDGCSFRTFLFRVLTARLQDFLKHLWRVQARHLPLTQANLAISCLRSAGRREEYSPATLAEKHETALRLQQALASLDSTARHLWAMMAFGMRLRTIAAQLDISYEAAKYQKRNLLAALRVRLREPSG